MPNSSFPRLGPEEAVAHTSDGVSVAFSGFGNVGAPKVIPRALAAVVGKQHMKGEPFKIRVLTGGASSVDIDEALAQAVTWRAPYQSAATLRKQIDKCANGRAKTSICICSRNYHIPPFFKA